ncbi:amidase [Fusarium subglutinans]|uniref:Amidase n=1 Tax=Gibberella subglutinans TaxID=42677 RepID=A0A8H5UXE4_GIBSU|nr:amidase [Fusarium subglutinans]KAF5601713.1 amidase [Fusarium subglutinans]
MNMSAKLSRPDIEGLDLQGVIDGLNNGDFSSQALVDAYLENIERFNDQVRAIACINPDVKAIAIQKDHERSSGQLTGKLHGVPILLKDTIVTTDSMDTTAGSFALVRAKYTQEAFVVSKLRAAGAIILGKANLSQWGMARSPKCASGWSSLFGQALGGFHVDQDPQGSSSGSAIALSLNMVSAALGGETCGSILYPAQRNGVVGLKPTVGLTSRAGTIPINPEQDSIGPLTGSVKDSAIILQVIAGKDDGDPATKDIPFDEGTPDYVSSCQKSGLQGVRVLVPLSVYKVVDSDPEVGTAFRAAIDTIKSLGATVVDGVDFKTWKPNGKLRDDLPGDVMLREAYESFFKSLKVNPHGIRSISDLIEFIKSEPLERYEDFGASWFESARDAPVDSDSDRFKEVNAKMEAFGAEIPQILDENDCDVLLASSSTDLPLDLGRLPGISVPLGFYSASREALRNSKGFITKGPNIPFAVTFTGRRFSEQTLIACAYAFEQATQVAKRNKDYLIVRPVNLARNELSGDSNRNVGTQHNGAEKDAVGQDDAKL